MSNPAKAKLATKRAEDLRLTIALAAHTLFVADGDTSATVERICETVGIAPRTFHRYFATKEDVVLPLFRRSEQLVREVLAKAPIDADPAYVLTHAFTTEVHQRQSFDFDRTFMTLMINTPEYRRRWLEWGEWLYEPITEFLSARMDLGTDPFLRELPAQLVVQTSRQAYTHWIVRAESTDFAEVEAIMQRGLTVLFAGLSAVTSPVAHPT
ncbi:TetR family transcriptional regulator [Nocardia sp. NPDC004123]